MFYLFWFLGAVLGVCCYGLGYNLGCLAGYAKSVGEYRSTVGDLRGRVDRALVDVLEMRRVMDARLKEDRGSSFNG